MLVAVAGCGPKPSTPTPPAPSLKLAWAFDAPHPGMSVAAPLVTPDAVYFAAVHTRGFKLSGAVYALDPNTGKRKWAFDRDGDMLPTASSPILAGGRLLLGEGMHANFVCQFYSLDPKTGREQWRYETGDHIEGGAVTGDGAIYFPAGNDGIVALDLDGQRKWNYRADFHTDSTPFLANGRLFFGSGASRRFKQSYVICLDAKSGEQVWRTPVPLPAWGPPVVANGKVFVGTGNGRLHEAAKPPETPAGAMSCFDAKTGDLLWAFPLPDAVFAQPVVVGERVVFGCRDGNLYGLSFDGKEGFRVSMGGPVMASAAVAGSNVVAVSVPGRVVCVNPADGAEVWRHTLTEREALVFAPPVVAGRRLFVAAETKAGNLGVVSLSCFEMPTLGIP
jgi:outer membrane protein assembly factor BamB